MIIGNQRIGQIAETIHLYCTKACDTCTALYIKKHTHTLSLHLYTYIYPPPPQVLF